MWFYDEVGIKQYLKKGENIFAVEVLRYPPEYWRGNYGMFRTEYPGLYVNGCVEDEDGNHYVMDTNESWKCRKNPGFHIMPESDDFAPLQIFENCQGEAELSGWKMPGYDAGAWMQALPYLNIRDRKSVV